MSFLIVFLISALMGMGVGGGGLFVIYLTLCLNFPQLLAQGTNLCLFIIAGVSSLFIHLKKRKIDLKQVLIMITLGCIGSVLSSSLVNSLDPKYARYALGALLVVSGLITLYNNLIKPLLKKFKKTLYK
ncbi:MAG: sulfite exporter TauE/SafE family protein [Clostridia bacterium]|nr:sulfite exporter TauE/SafE family protein [Clostridia bacterium]